MAIRLRVRRSRRFRSQRPASFPALTIEDLEREGPPTVRVLPAAGQTGAPGWEPAPPTSGPVGGDLAIERDPGGHVIELRHAPAADPAVPDTTYGSPAASGLAPAMRVERAVMALAWRSEVLSDRVGQLERRLGELADELFEGATQADLIEVEARRARLAAEVARLGTELRGAVDHQAAHVGQMARDLADLPRVAAAQAQREVESRLDDLRRAAAAGTTAPYRLPGYSAGVGSRGELDTLPADLLDRS